MENKQKVKASILVCGSSHFADKNFVIEMLSVLNKSLVAEGSCIGKIYTSKFSGACQYANLWASLHNERMARSNGEQVIVKDFTFDFLLEDKNHPFYDQANIPLPILQREPFFQKGKEMLLKENVHMVMAFPNEKGEMGASTRNIKRFANLASINFMDCTQAYRLLNEMKEKQMRELANSGKINMSEPTTMSRPVLQNQRRQLTR